MAGGSGGAAEARERERVRRFHCFQQNRKEGERERRISAHQKLGRGEGQRGGRRWWPRRRRRFLQGGERESEGRELHCFSFIKTEEKGRRERERRDYQGEEGRRRRRRWPPEMQARRKMKTEKERRRGRRGEGGDEIEERRKRVERWGKGVYVYIQRESLTGREREMVT